MPRPAYDIVLRPLASPCVFGRQYVLATRAMAFPCAATRWRAPGNGKSACRSPCSRCPQLLPAHQPLVAEKCSWAQLRFWPAGTFIGTPRSIPGAAPRQALAWPPSCRSPSAAWLQAAVTLCSPRAKLPTCTTWAYAPSASALPQFPPPAHVTPMRKRACCKGVFRPSWASISPI